MEQNQNEKLALTVSKKTIVWNIVLSIFKFAAGFLANSQAMISDAVHSASDVFSTLVVMVGIKMSDKDADSGHPYGHERFECVAALILSIILCITGFGIGYNALTKISSAKAEEIAVPGLLALVAAVTSIVVKEAMYWYTRAAAKKTGSGALMADAWHHRSDAFSSIGSLFGIAGARLGYPILDPIASLVICLMIVKASYDIFMDAINKMTDASCDEETLSHIRSLITAHNDVSSIDLLRARLFGDKIYVDVEISLKGDIMLTEAHNIAHEIHDELEKALPKVKHCMVHVNPCANFPSNNLPEDA